MTNPDLGAAGMIVGFGPRLLADLLDAFVLGIVGYAIGYPLRYSISSLGLHSLWVGLVFNFVYFGVFHARLGGGQTLGKRVVGIQVLKRDGTFLSFRDSLIRYLTLSGVFYSGLYESLVAFLPAQASTAGAVFMSVVPWASLACFVLVPFHPLKRGLHDLLAGSVVVYKGAYDAVALDRMENPAKARRVWMVLGGGTVAVMALTVFSLSSTKSDDAGELSALAGTLRQDYDVRGVSRMSINGQQPVLFVEVFLPLAQYEDKTERERLRGDVHKKVQADFQGLGKYQKISVITLSGFDLGIARLSWRDF